MGQAFHYVYSSYFIIYICYLSRLPRLVACDVCMSISFCKKWGGWRDRIGEYLKALYTKHVGGQLILAICQLIHSENMLWCQVSNSPYTSVDSGNLPDSVHNEFLWFVWTFALWKSRSNYQSYMLQWWIKQSNVPHKIIGKRLLLNLMAADSFFLSADRHRSSTVALAVAPAAQALGTTVSRVACERHWGSLRRFAQQGGCLSERSLGRLDWGILLATAIGRVTCCEYYEYLTGDVGY